MEETTSKRSTFKPQLVPEKNKTFFSEPWEDSDVVLVVEDKEFHVHRCILSEQSPVFDAMFNGSFKDSTQEKIELKNDKHEAMLLFLQLLYPGNMPNENGKELINNENVLSIVELADKYGVKNIITKCLTEFDDLEPENKMRLLPYILRRKLPVEKILDIIARHVSIDTLANFAPELDNESVYIKTLEKKCRIYEDVIERANTLILRFVNKRVTAAMDEPYQGWDDIWNDRLYNEPVMCVEHNHRNAQDFKKARKCKHCLEAYMKYFDKDYLLSCAEEQNLLMMNIRKGRYLLLQRAEELGELLKLADDIVNSLKE